ncbi:unnamed protein product, partial [marine sediment metagenome]
FKTATTLDPVIFDPNLLRRFGYPQEYVDEMKASIDSGMGIYKKLGVTPAYTCCPFYLLPAHYGEHIATAETTVQLFSNSILGARTNKESGPTALASAITGRTPFYGMHLSENRRGQVLVKLKEDIDLSLFTYADYSALGYYVASQAVDKIPVYTGFPVSISRTELLYFSSSHSTASSLSMFHIVGITPEAPTVEAAFGNGKPLDTIVVGKKEIRDTYEIVTSATDESIDWVLFGCPHVTLQHIKDVALLLDGKKIHENVKLIVATSDPIRVLAQRMGRR